MVQKNTKLIVIDNSGSSVLKCLHVCKKSKFNSATAIPGIVIVASVKRLRKSIPKKLIIKSKICFALVTSVAYPITRFTGVTVKSEINSAIILGKYNKKGVQKK
jgi:ribosomal protein L14